jgi:hypothetical protein
MTRKIKQYKPIKFGDGPDPGTVEGPEQPCDDGSSGGFNPLRHIDGPRSIQCSETSSSGFLTRSLRAA